MYPSGKWEEWKQERNEGKINEWNGKRYRMKEMQWVSE